jgi:hypothetical protein
LSLALGDPDHQLSNRSTVVRVSGYAASSHAEKVPGGDCVGVRAAYTQFGFLTKRVDDAWPHIAILAANTQTAESALRLLLLEAIPRSLNALLPRSLN